ncbi:hypothetical protein ABL78_5629 [Leptomonas seymouri]|uniref:Uncharacterized protein n=1 Tax=Leptomonas seymouri TaxID=5684 RepID=A0A0N0P4W9_LEPSE|nr:hypothetical protein ABL78_5629 [Leptomonas seymouri]|eukprot:KPI85317.1 hypothetical protein ABL78_5629 [Leptomonas seymouri]
MKPTNNSGSASSSASSADEGQMEAVAQSSSSATLAGIQHSAAAAGVEEVGAETVPGAAQGASFTASERRRQTTLFLGDAEQFAFDFGGEATTIAETVVADEAAQRAARRAEELEDATARAVVASAGRRSEIAAARPLTAEEVSDYAAASLACGPRQFVSLLKVGASRKRAQASAATSVAGQSEEVPNVAAEARETTLAEAMTAFKAALRRYDEGLWREHKQRREEEEQRRIKARKRQRA